MVLDTTSRQLGALWKRSKSKPLPKVPLPAPTSGHFHPHWFGAVAWLKNMVVFVALAQFLLCMGFFPSVFFCCLAGFSLFTLTSAEMCQRLHILYRCRLFWTLLRPASLEPAVEWKMESFQMVALALFGNDGRQDAIWCYLLLGVARTPSLQRLSRANVRCLKKWRLLWGVFSPFSPQRGGGLGSFGIYMNKVSVRLVQV